jgi:ribonuclease HI
MCNDINLPRPTIFTDDLATVLRFMSTDEGNGQQYAIRALPALVSTKQKGNPVTLHWIPGHAKITGNDRADTVAKRTASRGTMWNLGTKCH